MSSFAAHATSSSGESTLTNDVTGSQAVSASPNGVNGSTASTVSFHAIIRPGDAAAVDASTSIPGMTYSSTPSGGLRFKLITSEHRDQSASSIQDVLVYTDGRVELPVETLAQTPEGAFWHVRVKSNGWFQMLKRLGGDASAARPGGVREMCFGGPGSFEMTFQILTGGR